MIPSFLGENYLTSRTWLPQMRMYKSLPIKKTTNNYNITNYRWKSLLISKATSVTSSPSDLNFFEYCLLDFLELFVTKTIFLPCTKPIQVSLLNQ